MSDALFPYLLFWIAGLLFFAIEIIRPARPLQYRSVLLKDLVSLGMYNIFFLLAVNITDRIPIPNYASATLLTLPLFIKLILFYVVEDFGLYWVHRIMHTGPVWRVHKWHHSPRYMYWLAGVRTTIPHIIFFNLTYVVALPLLHAAPSWIFFAISVEHVLRNNWMHMNVVWRSRWLEWIFVTPRYHHIHHSDDPRHYTSNFGSLFTFWDRIFGTYLNPEDVKQEITFGIGERPNPVRLILGV
ncbi:MAG: sterol desaturase family protein [Nitrospirales bacterium]